MKKILPLILAILFTTFSLSACEETHACVHTEPEKITDYLYEISYEDYSWDIAKDALSRLPEGQASAFGCSSVRNGNFYGRSFDFTYNEMSEFVVRSTAGKYKNIGIAIANTNLSPTIVENGLSDDIYKVLPFTVVDGINEKGVVCNANVVPVFDMEKETTGTNKKGEDYFYQFLCRYILDNAGSAKEAVDLIKNKINVTNKFGDVYGLKKANYELHYMVADKNNTYVLEFVNNSIKVINEVIMTNYYLSVPYTPHASGIERYNTLKFYYKEGTSLEGMAQLMQRVQYTNICKMEGTDLSTNAGWYSDLSTADLDIWQSKALFENEPIAAATLLTESYNIFASGDRSQTHKTVTVNIGGNDVDFEVKAPWQSVHMSVYDILNKTMRLVVQEKYDSPMLFKL